MISFLHFLQRGFIITHILAGFTCILLFWICFFSPKKSNLHTKFGHAYYNATLFMCISALFIVINSFVFHIEIYIFRHPFTSFAQKIGTSAGGFFNAIYNMLVVYTGKTLILDQNAEQKLHRIKPLYVMFILFLIALFFVTLLTPIRIPIPSLLYTLSFLSLIFYWISYSPRSISPKTIHWTCMFFSGCLLHFSFFSGGSIKMLPSSMRITNSQDFVATISILIPLYLISLLKINRPQKI